MGLKRMMLIHESRQRTWILLKSQEMYHDFQHPEKFAGKLPVLFDNRQGDVIYGVPRRFPGIARVVDRARLEAIPPFGRAHSPAPPSCR